MDMITLAAARKYVNDTANALGAVKGSPCTIKSITETDDGATVVFSWTGADGVEQTSSTFLPRGPQGLPGEKGDPGVPGKDGSGTVDTVAREQITALTEEIEKLKSTGSTSAVEWEILVGYARDDGNLNGNPRADANRMTCADPIPVSAGVEISVDADLSEYRWAIAQYDSDGTFLKTTGWIEIASRDIVHDGYIVPNIKRVDEGTVSNDDATKVRNAVEIKSSSGGSNSGTVEVPWNVLVGYARDDNPFGSSPRADANRMTGDDYVPVSTGMKIVVSADLSDYLWAIAQYDSDGTFLKTTGWIEIASRNIVHDGYISINFKQPDESAMQKSDGTAVQQGIKFIKEVQATQSSTLAVSSLNIFNPPLYHHMNQEDNRSCNIPAQSLADIHYARELGFNNIEVNPQLCSDGVYVCKHGSGGYLGYGLSVADGKDPQATKFADVTSTWIRENVRYTSSLDKYNGVIPTLDEFCAECRKLNMIVKIAGIEPLAVARKYLPDDMIWTTASERGDFRGTVEYVWNPTKDVDLTILNCKEIGTPLNIVIEAGTFDDMNDELVIEMCAKAHANGFTVGTVYPSSESLLRAWRLGIDTAGATSTNVNYLPCGNEKNIVSLDDTDLELTNATYNSSADTLTITNGGSVTVDGDAFKAGIASLRIRYSGTLTIYNNEKKNHLDAYVSDGSNVVELSTVIQQLGVTKYTRWLTIEANADTTIYDFELHCSRI